MGTKKNKDIKLLRKQADKLRDQGVYFQAITLFDKLYLLCDKQCNRLEAGRSLFQIGLCYRMALQSQKALKALDKAIKYFQKYDIKERVAYAYREKGTVYLYMDKPAEAKKWYLKSLEIFKDSTDEDNYGMSITRVGLAEKYLKNYTKAEKLLKQGLKLVIKGDNWFFKVLSYFFLARLYYSKKQYQLAIDNLEHTETILDQNHQTENHIRVYSMTWGMLARCHLKLGNLEIAKNYFIRALDHIFSMPDNIATSLYKLNHIEKFLKELIKKTAKKTR